MLNDHMPVGVLIGSRAVLAKDFNGKAPGLECCNTCYQVIPIAGFYIKVLFVGI